MFSRPKAGKAKVQGKSRLKQILFGFSCLIALFCYYLLLDFKSTNAKALSGELTLGGGQMLQQTPQGSGLIAFLFDYCGSFVYVLPLFIIYIGFVLCFGSLRLKEIDFFKAGLKILGFNTFVLGCTALFSALWRNQTMGEGGILGDFLNILLGAVLSDSLAAVAAFFLSLIGLLLIIGKNPLQLLESLGGFVLGLFGKKDEKEPEKPGKAAEQNTAVEELAGTVQEIDARALQADLEGRYSKMLETEAQVSGSAPLLGQTEQGKSPLTSAGAAAAAGAALAAGAVQAQQSQTLASQNGTRTGLNKAEPSFGDDGLQDFARASHGIGPAGFRSSSEPRSQGRPERVEPGFGGSFNPAYQSAAAATLQNRPGVMQSSSSYAQQQTVHQGRVVPEDTAYTAPRAEEPAVSTIITRSTAVVTPNSGYSAAPVQPESTADQGVSTIVTVQQPEPAPSSENLVQDDPDEVHTVITYHQPEPATPESAETEPDNEVHTNIFTSPAPAAVPSAPAAPAEPDVPASIITTTPAAPTLAASSFESPAAGLQHTAPAAAPETAVPQGQAPQAAVPSAMEEYSELSPSADSYGPSQLKPEGNIINFADFVDEEEEKASFEVETLPESMRVHPAAESHGTAGLQDDKEHIKEKDLAERYPSASRGVLSAGRSPESVENQPQALAAPELTALQEPSALQARVEPAAATAEQYTPEAASGFEPQKAALAPSFAQPEPNSEVNVEPSQVPQMPLPEHSDAGVQEEAPQEAAQGSYALYNQGQNSSSSNLPAYMQHTDNGINVEGRDAPLESKPLDFNFTSSSVSAPATFYDSWRPGIELLTPSPQVDEVDENLLIEQAQLIDTALRNFKIKAHVVSYENGPVITRFALELEPGVRFSSINNIVGDLARNIRLNEHSVRAISSLPGTIYAGLEVPSPQRRLISLHEVADSAEFMQTKAELPLCLGTDVVGKPVVVDLATAPHLLIAGTTGSGKSAGLNAMLISLLLKKSPAELRLILIDPKRLEFSLYNDLPHLITPVITDIADKAGAALSWCIDEMERRYKLIEAFKVRKLSEYNAIIEEAQLNGELVADPAWSPEVGGTPPALKKLPYIVVVIEEFADLMAQTSGRGKKGEDSPDSAIGRLAAKSRACGIHIILATQTPRAEILTGFIRANMPSRIAFSVQNSIESQLVLAETGAECLLGMGDMLGKFSGYNRNSTFRAHGAFVPNSDVARVVESWKEHGSPEYVDSVAERPEELESDEEQSEGKQGGIGKRDALLDQVAEYARDYFAKNGKAVPVSEVQMVFGVGYPRAKKLMLQLQREGMLNG